MAFTDELWRGIEPIYAAILRHPFLRGLTDGSLPRESFRFYAVQDALYLREFARALSLAAARAPQDAWIIMFNEHAAGALRVERSLHESFFKEFGLTSADVAATTSVGPCGVISRRRAATSGCSGTWATRVRGGRCEGDALRSRRHAARLQRRRGSLLVRCVRDGGGPGRRGHRCATRRDPRRG